MSDLSKCYGVGCDKRETCRRYTDEAKVKWQPYLIQQVSVPDPKLCRFYVSNEENNHGS